MENSSVSNRSLASGSTTALTRSVGNSGIPLWAFLLNMPSFAVMGAGALCTFTELGSSALAPGFIRTATGVILILTSFGMQTPFFFYFLRKARTRSPRLRD